MLKTIAFYAVAKQLHERRDRVGNKTKFFKELTNKYSSMGSEGEISRSKYRAGEVDTLLYEVTFPI